ncbi:aldose epimerase family protein [Cohaesibacter celericrescens]|uniref:aldose epimerase family protein n=1 Tax=Cohaesibacter celericrescens TaxID=2067669 RepID=UPI003565AFCE
MQITSHKFGTFYNQAVNKIHLENDRGMSAQIIELGGIVTSMIVPDDKGVLADVVLGFDDLKSYATDSHYFGALIGRVANRIEGAQFRLNNETTHVDANAYQGRHCVHGGRFGYHHRVWRMDKTEKTDTYVAVTLVLDDKDGEEGFQNDVHVQARYELDNNNRLTLSFFATASGPTPISLTAHSYFNLQGHDTTSIANHSLTIFSKTLLEQREDRLPNGQIISTEGTRFSLSSPTLLQKIVSDGFEINHSYVIDETAQKPAQTLRRLAQLEAAGRHMQVWSNESTLHFYNGHNLDGVKGKGGTTYNRFAGLCLEPKGFVNGINEPAFPCCIIDQETPYHHSIMYDFGNASH